MAAVTFSIADWSVLGTYFVATLLVGLWFTRGERSSEDYFLGGRRQPWIVVGLSILATELSALTFVNVPADSFKGDCNYLQMYAGAILGRLLIVVALLPAFYAARVTTVYEYLGQRFGPWTRTSASVLFFASRIIGSGIRLLAASLAISIVFGWRLEWVIVGVTCVAVVYTAIGGIKAIIWTDALQALVFIAGAVAVVVYLFSAVPGSVSENLSAGYEAGKFKIFTFTAGESGWNNEKLFWMLLITATAQNMAALGTDQDLTQRMLTCSDLKRGQRSLMFSAVIGLPVVSLFLLIGVLMFVYFQAFPDAVPPADVLDHNDRIFPYFIAHILPSGWGLRGLLVAGLFAAAMSSLDSALGAMSSTAVTDLYKPFLRPGASDRESVIVGRVFVVAFGVLLAVVALGFSGQDNLLWEAFKWAGLVFGALLGVFLLAVLTKRRGGDRWNVVAMASSVAVVGGIKWYQDSTELVYIAWPWWIVIGTTWTFVVGACGRTRSAPSVTQT